MLAAPASVIVVVLLTVTVAGQSSPPPAGGRSDGVGVTKIVVTTPLLTVVVTVLIEVMREVYPGAEVGVGGGAGTCGVDAGGAGSGVAITGGPTEAVDLVGGAGAGGAGWGVGAGAPGATVGTIGTMGMGIPKLLRRASTCWIALLMASSTAWSCSGGTLKLMFVVMEVLMDVFTVVCLLLLSLQEEGHTYVPRIPKSEAGSSTSSTSEALLKRFKIERFMIGVMPAAIMRLIVSALRVSSSV